MRGYIIYDTMPDISRPSLVAKGKIVKGVEKRKESSLWKEGVRLVFQSQDLRRGLSDH